MAQVWKGHVEMAAVVEPPRGKGVAHGVHVLMPLLAHLQQGELRHVQLLRKQDKLWTSGQAHSALGTLMSMVVQPPLVAAAAACIPSKTSKQQVLYTAIAAGMERRVLAGRTLSGQAALN